MRDDDQTLLLVFGAAWLLGWFERSVGPALRQGERALQNEGADLYERMHPSERGHANDLPDPGRMVEVWDPVRKRWISK